MSQTPPIVSAMQRQALDLKMYQNDLTGSLQCEGSFSHDVASMQVDAMILNIQTWTPRWWYQMGKGNRCI